jgi:hypothetical protein
MIARYNPQNNGNGHKPITAHQAALERFRTFLKRNGTLTDVEITEAEAHAVRAIEAADVQAR